MTVEVVALDAEATVAELRAVLAGIADHVDLLVVVAPGADGAALVGRAAALLGDADVITALAPAIDAVKVVAGADPERVVRDVDRTSLRRPGRPQLVRRSALVAALAGRIDGLDQRGDPASVVASAGGEVRPWPAGDANDLDRP